MKLSEKSNILNRAYITRLSTLAKISAFSLILLFVELCCFAQKATVVPESNIEPMSRIQSLTASDGTVHPMMSEVAMETEVLLGQDKGVKAAPMSMSDFRQRARTSSYESKRKSGTNQRRGSRSSASTDTDADGIPDSIDLCPDYMDTALDFDGIDDHVTVPNDPALNVGVGDFTFQAWVNLRYKNSGNYTILSNGVGGGVVNYWFYFSPNSLVLYFAGEYRSVSVGTPYDEWTHVAVTLNGATKQATFYINGVAEPTPTPYSLSPDTSNTNPLIIGYLPPSNYNAFKGQMDDVVIWNTIRTAEEIACSMSTSIDGSEAGQMASYDMNESAACIDNTSTTMIVDQSPNGLGGQLNNFSLLPGCISNWSSGRNLDSDQNGFGDGCDYFCYDSDLDGTPDSIDLCPDYSNVALDFDGIDDHVSIPHNAALNIGEGDFTLQAWIYPTNLGTDNTILHKGTGGPGTSDYHFKINQNSEIAFFYAGAWQYGSTTIPANEWSHIAVSFSITTKQAIFYLNGQVDATGSYTNPADTTDTNPLIIGRKENCMCDQFEGKIDDIAIWNTTRTAAEIACSMTSTLTGSEAGLVACYDMNESAACVDNITANMVEDQSPNGFNGLLNNFSLLSGCTSNWSSGRNLDSDQDGLGDGCSACFNFDIDSDGIPDSIDLCPNYLDVALDFDGNNDHVSVPHDVALNIGGGDFTLQAWVKPTGNNHKTIVSKGSGGVSATSYIYSIDPSFNQGLFYAGAWQYSNTALPSNMWSHVAVSFNNTTKQATFYVNGMADGQANYPAAPYTSDTNPLYIGRQGYNCTCNFFEGRIDDVAIWSTTRTAVEIKNDMATKIGGYEAGLVASYNMNESEACIYNANANMITDQSPNGFGGQLINFSLIPGCTSNYSPGRNLDSDQNGFGDGCDYGCNAGLTKLYVDSSATGGHNLGSSWADAYMSLSTALSHAAQCPDIDSVYVAEGTYFPDIVVGLTNPRKASFLIPEAAHILGQFPSGGGTMLARDTTFQTILSGDIGIVGDSLDNVYHVVRATGITSQSSVDGLVITGGQADGGGVDDFGGGWFNDGSSPRISNCKFIGNRAIVGGGGLLNFNSSPMISNCFFTDCLANRGGAMYNEVSSLQISHCTFSHNQAVDPSFFGQGGAVSNLGSAPIFDACSFTANTATNGGGIAASDSSTVTLNDCQFNENTALLYGGGIYSDSSTLVAQNATFTSNSSNYIGGGIFNQYASVSLLDCEFSMNTTAQFGGGISLVSAPLTANNVMFTSNTSSLNGGGIYSVDNSISLTDCQFNMNTATERGGGLALDAAPLVAQNVTFTSNTSNLYGGGIYSQDASVSLLYCDFNLNTATAIPSPYSFGGAISGQMLSSFLLSSCHFSENSATGGGGAVSITDAGVSQVKNCTFKFNQVHNGSNIGTGGAYQVGGSGQTDFFNCLFEANQAQGSADDGGGAIMIYGGSVTLANNTVVNNHSATHGGAISIYNDACDATLNNTVLWKNTATTDSTIYNGNGGSASMNYDLIPSGGCPPNVTCGVGMIYNQDPMFVDGLSTPPLGGDFSLQANSPAINTGKNDLIPPTCTTDLNGIYRILEDTIDIGAYEFNDSPIDMDIDGIPDSVDLCPNYRDVALHFDGIDDHITVPHDPVLNVGSGDFTFQAWVNQTAPGWNTILCKGAGSPGITDYIFSINQSLVLGLKLNGTWNFSTTAIPLNTWNHVAVSFNSSTNQATFYLNGMADGVVTYPSAPTSADTNPLFIGQQGFTCACNHFEGRIDDVAIWNTMRTDIEISCDMGTRLTGSEAGLVVAYVMNESAACRDNTAMTMIGDQSPNGFGGLLNNFSLLPGCISNWSSGRNLDSDQDGAGDGCDFICNTYDTDADGIPDSIDLCPDHMDTALDFDGIDDHISVPHHAALNVGSGNFTFQAWVNPTAPGWSTILCKGAGSPGITDYIFSINPSSVLGLELNNTWNFSTTAIALNTWSHVAVSFNSITKQATFYLNGMADGVVSYPNAPTSADTNSLFIGQQGFTCACNHFEGRIDDIAIWNTMRTAGELAIDMATSIDPSEAGLVASYDMNEATACNNNTSTTMVIDQSPNGYEGQLINFSQLLGCSSNWSSGRNLDSDNDGIGDACDDIACPTSLTLTGNQLSNAIYLSDGNILSNQIISSPAVIEYNTATSVELITPFEVQMGATLTTKNDGCD